MEAVVNRLESVATRLEKLAASGGAGRSTGDEKAERPVQVEEYEQWLNGPAKAFFDATAKVKGCEDIGKDGQTAFKRIGDLIAASCECAKPSNSDLMKFLDPCVKIVTKYQNPDSRKATFSHEKGFNEIIQIINWVMLPNPIPHCQTQLEASEFYLNKILVTAKNLPDNEKEANRAFVTTMKGLVAPLQDFIKNNNYKMGLTWKAGGKPLSSWSPSATGGIPPPIGLPPPPVGLPPPPAATSATGSGTSMAAVFKDLNKGLDITQGLKKVTADMKTKNMKDRPPAAVVPKSAPAPVARKPAAQAVKPPKMEYRQGTWFVEHYTENLEIKDVKMKDAVYLLKATNCVFEVPNKCKSVCLDGCKKVTLIIDTVVSGVEVINCSSLKIFVKTSCPSIAIDKTNGCLISLTKESSEPFPGLVVASSSELNVSLPPNLFGKNDPNADPVELPIAEQFLVKFDPASKGLAVTPVTHGD